MSLRVRRTEIGRLYGWNIRRALRLVAIHIAPIRASVRAVVTLQPSSIARPFLRSGPPSFPRGSFRFLRFYVVASKIILFSLKCCCQRFCRLFCSSGVIQGLRLIINGYTVDDYDFPCRVWTRPLMSHPVVGSGKDLSAVLARILSLVHQFLRLGPGYSGMIEGPLVSMHVAGSNLGHEVTHVAFVYSNGPQMYCPESQCLVETLETGSNIQMGQHFVTDFRPEVASLADVEQLHPFVRVLLQLDLLQLLQEGLLTFLHGVVLLIVESHQTVRCFGF